MAWPLNLLCIQIFFISLKLSNKFFIYYEYWAFSSRAHRLSSLYILFFVALSLSLSLFYRSLSVPLTVASCCPVAVVLYPNAQLSLSLCAFVVVFIIPFVWLLAAHKPPPFPVPVPVPFPRSACSWHICQYWQCHCHGHAHLRLVALETRSESHFIWPSWKKPLSLCKQRWSVDSAFFPLISDNFLVVDIAAAHMPRPLGTGLTFCPWTFCIVFLFLLLLFLELHFKAATSWKMLWKNSHVNAAGWGGGEGGGRTAARMRC